MCEEAGFELEVGNGWCATEYEGRCKLPSPEKGCVSVLVPPRSWLTVRHNRNNGYTYLRIQSTVPTEVLLRQKYIRDTALSL
ncbi:hypothetical protein E2C01_066072 [Portunus trituberculatus]|uniref:Uncharacterized protein n=1 Tax=Portunus trituberculatus TaxID=210409 RepID=A0A5B7HNT5_PORTR|nr:hypothetical protein [Portunus trituberculatus]